MEVALEVKASLPRLAPLLSIVGVIPGAVVFGIFSIGAGIFALKSYPFICYVIAGVCFWVASLFYFVVSALLSILKPRRRLYLFDYISFTLVFALGITGAIYELKQSSEFKLDVLWLLSSLGWVLSPLFLIFLSKKNRRIV